MRQARNPCQTAGVGRRPRSVTSWSGIGRALATIGLVASTAACATTAPSGAPVDLGSVATPVPPDPAVVAAHRAAGIPPFVDPPGAPAAGNLAPDAPASTATAGGP